MEVYQMRVIESENISYYLLNLFWRFLLSTVIDLEMVKWESTSRVLLDTSWRKKGLFLFISWFWKNEGKEEGRLFKHKFERIAWRKGWWGLVWTEFICGIFSFYLRLRGDYAVNGLKWGTIPILYKLLDNPWSIGPSF